MSFLSDYFFVVTVTKIFKSPYVINRKKKKEKKSPFLNYVRGLLMFVGN